MIERIYYRVKLNTDQIIYSQSIDILEAKLNENIIKDPSKTYLVWKGSQFPNSTNAAFKAPAGCTIDWGDGNVETFETASTVVNTHTYTDGIEYHLISLSNYTVVDSGSFSYCSGLTSVTIGNDVTSISDNAFRDCSGLTSIIIPDSVTSIGDNAFFGCSGLTSVTIPNSVTGMGYQAFHNCSDLTSITIPDSVISISYAAFSGCSGLTSVTIGNSVRNIGSSAFSGCSGLTSVTIPDSVTFMGDYAFDGCSGLKNIKISAINPPTLGSDAFAETSLEKIIVPKSSIDAYKSADGWSTYADKIVYEVDSSDIDLIAPSAALNIKNGTGLDSLVQKYSGEVDATHFGNTCEGESGAVFGEANFNSGNRTLISGKMNKSSAPNSLIVGLGNGRGIDADPTIDVLSGEQLFVFGALNSVSNGNGNVVLGAENTLSNVRYTTIIGRGNIIDNTSLYEGKCVVGRFNNQKPDTMFEVGVGDYNNRLNGFEVLKDGRAKVQTAPTENNDVVRKLELDNVNARYVSTSILGG